MTPQARASGGLRIGFEDDVIAEAFEAPFKVGDGSGLTDLVEMGFAEIAIGQVLSWGGRTSFICLSSSCSSGSGWV
jgi:hypothetical protein